MYRNGKRYGRSESGRYHDGGTVRVSSQGRKRGKPLQNRRLCRDKKFIGRRLHQGVAPGVYRRRDGRRTLQHRLRSDIRQLRRKDKTPHDGGRRLFHRFELQYHCARHVERRELYSGGNYRNGRNA